MPNKTVSVGERANSFAFWRQQEQALQGNKLVTAEGLRWLSICTQPNNIGYGQGEIRPGKLGQWDMYYFLTQETQANLTEALLISGLTVTEVAHESKRAEMEEEGLNIDNPADVLEFERRQAMTPAELDEEIARLEALLSA